MNIVVIDGPNINLLGIREPEIYGTGTYSELKKELRAFAKEYAIKLTFKQSNHEGDLVDYVQEAIGKFDAIIINAAAYTHTSIALLDAILASKLPTVEVHLSNTDKRENFRKISFLRQACIATFQGEGVNSYQNAIRHLHKVLNVN